MYLHCGKVSSKGIQIRLGQKCKLLDSIAGCLRDSLLCGIHHIHINAFVKIATPLPHFAQNYPDNSGNSILLYNYFSYCFDLDLDKHLHFSLFAFRIKPKRKKKVFLKKNLRYF